MADYEDLLARYHGQCQMVHRQGRSFPAAIAAQSAGPGDGQWCVLPASVQPDVGLVRAGAAHLAAIRRATPAMFDGTVAAFAGWRSDGRLVVAPGSYFDMIATCDALRAEVQGAAPGTPLTMRAAAERAAVSRPFEVGNGRVAAVGVSLAVTVMGQGGQRQVLLGRRSHAVALDAGQVHLVPSGMAELHHGPVETARQELTEELGLDFADGTQLVELGVGWDLLRLRPEICLWLELAGAHEVASALLDQRGDGEFGDRWLADVGGASWGAFWAAQSPEAVAPAAAAALALLESVL